MDNIRKKIGDMRAAWNCEDDSLDLRKQKGLHTKELIILNSIHILFQEGRRGLTARKLADKAGISKGNIFHHFKNMDNVIEESFKFILKYVENSFKSIKYDNLSDFLKTVGINILEVTKTEMEHTNNNPHVFWDLVFNNEKLKKLLIENDLAIKAWFIEVIEALINKSLSHNTKEYILNVSMNFMSGAKSHIFLFGEDIESYKTTWLVLAKHLEEKILEDKVSKEK